MRLIRLINSYKDVVMRRELPQENVKYALLTLAKMLFCESTSQSEGYHDLLNFIKIAVEFFKSYNTNKPKESRPSHNKVKPAAPEKEFSSVIKYIQEDLYEGNDDNEKKVQIIEKVKEFQNNHRRSKSIDFSAKPQIKPFTIINKSNINESFENNTSHLALAKKIKKGLRTNSLDYISTSLHEQDYPQNPQFTTHGCVNEEDFRVERLHTDIETATKSAQIYRAKTKKLLFEHDRFVKKIFLFTQEKFN